MKTVFVFCVLKVVAKMNKNELEQKLGFPERAADVRIAQYESE